MKVMAMTPVQALLWLIPGGLAGLALLGISVSTFSTLHPAMNLAIAALGLLPSAVVVGWGTMKFRSYYEVKRTRTNYLTMAYATLIQFVALAFSAFLFIQLLVAVDLIGVQK
ncbi:hypothetical protein [Paeniglutamicibacter antarcticus]|uniref:Uncharacterized protein n=1 Tax=Paeniglutamicibacter antarcticus TaxID=494023 RepID=A0ABP9TMJ5_9MICC